VQPLSGSIPNKIPAYPQLDVKILRETTTRLPGEAKPSDSPDILAGLRRAAVAEESELGRQTLEHLIHNYEVAAAEQLPVCQDSGITVVLLEVGQDVHWTGGNLQEAIFEGITQGTKQGYLRWSLIGDPLARRNPGGTPPASSTTTSFRAKACVAHRRVEGVRRREHERAAHVHPG
jgi:fumarate hydratase subunit alpha